MLPRSPLNNVEYSRPHTTHLAQNSIEREGGGGGMHRCKGNIQYNRKKNKGNIIEKKIVLDCRFKQKLSCSDKDICVTPVAVVKVSLFVCLDY